jgi:hypothetical protein
VKENTRNPAEIRVLSVVKTTQQAGQKRISGDGFSLSKTAGGVCETSDKIPATTY